MKIFIATAATKKLSNADGLDVSGPMKVELDIAATFRTDGSFDPNDKDSKAIRNDLKKNGLGLKVVEFRGPGGGWPIVEVFGTKANITKYLKEHYLKGEDKETIQEFISSIVKV